MAGEPTGEDTFDVPVRGVDVDSETRCAHYHTGRDVIAIAFPCCDVFYPCFECHEACCEHEPARWPPDRFDERAVLCGVCGAVLRIDAYLASEHRCLHCEAAFNPRCANHWKRYFRLESDR
jgi:uncharacterized CHY-type Zn-finger protein